MMNKLFKNVGGSRPGRSAFNLSYEKKLTCDLGELIPVMVDSCIPGDVWTIGNQMVLRFTPLVAPILHEVDVYVHYFFVPDRLCYNTTNWPTDYGTWEEYITGGVDGNDDSPPLYYNPGPTGFAKGGIGDYFGMPVGVEISDESCPDFIPWIAYYEIWNEYYRDENLQDKIDHTYTGNLDAILKRNWEKDYFTSALLTQQRGTAPAIPITGSSSAVWDAASIVQDGRTYSVTADSSTAGDNKIYINNATGRNNLYNFFNDNEVSFATASPIDINDMREALQIQRFLERNMRAGVRYVEFLQSHFGVSPSDERLQRPEYIGGCKCPVVISEVLQTSKTDGTAYQGTMTGHGIAVNQEYICKYRVQEFGWILGIMSIMPKPSYQQGVNRQFMKRNRYDYYFPEFAHLSEQAITRNEIYATNVPNDNLTVFGFCGAYDEHRIKNSMVCGNFRDTYDYWHMGRQFASAPELNSSFIQCNPRKDCFAVQNEDCCLVQFGNLITCLRPMPIIAEPGMLDHG